MVFLALLPTIRLFSNVCFHQSWKRSLLVTQPHKARKVPQVTEGHFLVQTFISQTILFDPTTVSSWGQGKEADESPLFPEQNRHRGTCPPQNKSYPTLFLSLTGSISPHSPGPSKGHSSVLQDVFWGRCSPALQCSWSSWNHLCSYQAEMGLVFLKSEQQSRRRLDLLFLQTLRILPINFLWEKKGRSKIPCPWQGVGTQWSLRPIPTQTFLWFYVSVVQKNPQTPQDDRESQL